jgi:chorismate-pyruvate lyase
LAHPLDEFYARTELSLPPLQEIDPESVPEPYKTLLVHQHDMTSTLENFHGDTLRVRVLSRRRRQNEYSREVILYLQGTEVPVEFGAIKIYLDRFPPAARRQILAEEWPLGRILKDCGLAYTSQPKAFLRIASDKLINELLHLRGANLLYGRRNTLFAPSGQTLAEIVEILPPAAPKGEK